jgi:predicted transcriptional regulator with HTH domain
VITYTREVTNSSASDKNYRVLLKVVSDTGNVGGCLKTVGKSYSRDLTKCGVRLLRACGGNLSTYASLLRCGLVGCFVGKGVKTYLKYRCLRLVSLVLTTLSNELVKGWHSSFSSSFLNSLTFILQTHKSGA